MEQLYISILLGVTAFILICFKKHVASACCVLISFLIGVSALLNFSVQEGYAEEGIQFTFDRISNELKEGNRELVIKVLDETDKYADYPDTYSPGSKNMRNIFTRLVSAKRESDKVETTDE